MQACTGTLEKKTRHELSTRDWDKSPLGLQKMPTAKKWLLVFHDFGDGVAARITFEGALVVIPCIWFDPRKPHRCTTYATDGIFDSWARGIDIRVLHATPLGYRRERGSVSQSPTPTDNDLAGDASRYCRIAWGIVRWTTLRANKVGEHDQHLIAGYSDFMPARADLWRTVRIGLGRHCLVHSSRVCLKDAV